MRTSRITIFWSTAKLFHRNRFARRTVRSGHVYVFSCMACCNLVHNVFATAYGVNGI